MVTYSKIKSNFTEFYPHNKRNQWFQSNISGKNKQLFQFYVLLLLKKICNLTVKIISELHFFFSMMIESSKTLTIVSCIK